MSGRFGLNKRLKSILLHDQRILTEYDRLNQALLRTSGSVCFAIGVTLFLRPGALQIEIIAALARGAAGGVQCASRCCSFPPAHRLACSPRRDL